MTKVKIISGWDYVSVESEVNEFTASHMVTNIKFQVSGANICESIYAVMIVYEEDK